jgi:hypothetical protein
VDQLAGQEGERNDFAGTEAAQLQEAQEVQSKMGGRAVLGALESTDYPVYE